MQRAVKLLSHEDILKTGILDYEIAEASIICVLLLSSPPIISDVPT